MIDALTTLLERPQQTGRDDGLLLDGLAELTEMHRVRCEGYGALLDALPGGPRVPTAIEDVPWLPVRLFKHHDLKSVAEADVFRVITSSGTTSEPSRISVDAADAKLQATALARSWAPVLGDQRRPMLIIDTRDVTRGSSFSARGAGVLGMMNFGRRHTFALRSDLSVDVEAIRGFLDKYGDQPFFVFGFTFMVWSYLLEPLQDAGVDMSNGTLVHGGGWKKLLDQAVDNEEFKRRLRDGLGIADVHDYYGMVEQIGTVHIEGPGTDPGLSPPNFADVIIRHPSTLEPVEPGEVGVIQVLSLLPHSYPGHSLLTEDLGYLETSAGSWPGSRLKIVGRIPRAEARGCSDTFVTAA